MYDITYGTLEPYIDHQVVDVGLECAVSDVVHMAGQVVACGTFRDEGAELDVF